MVIVAQQPDSVVARERVRIILGGKTKTRTCLYHDTVQSCIPTQCLGWHTELSGPQPTTTSHSLACDEPSCFLEFTSSAFYVVNSTLDDVFGIDDC